MDCLFTLNQAQGTPDWYLTWLINNKHKLHKE